MSASQPSAEIDPGRRLVVAGFVLVLIIGLVLIALSWDRPAEQVSVRELWLRPEAHDGDRVAIEGTLRVFLDGTPLQHYAVEDARRNRVGIRGVERSRLDQLVDQPVSVEGRLRITTDRGILIDVTSIAATTD